MSSNIAAPPLGEELLWELSPKPYGSVKKSSPKSNSGVLEKRARYTLRCATDEHRPLPPRVVHVVFELTDPTGYSQPLIWKRKLSSAKKQASLQFAVYNRAEWKITVTSPALIKTVHVNATINIVPGSAYDLNEEKGFENLDDLEIARIDPTKLTPQQQAILDKWPGTDGKTTLSYPQDLAIVELERDSVYKRLAFEQGLIRPFLFLVSMHPRSRLGWAKTLNVEILENEYGDSHWEAHRILTRDFKGVQARANHAFTESVSPVGKDCNWYQILQRVGKKAADKKKTDEQTKQAVKDARKDREESMQACMNPDSGELHELEELFFKALVEVLNSIMEEQNPQELAKIKTRMEDPVIVPLVEATMKAGYKDEELAKYLAAKAHIGEPMGSVDKEMQEWAKGKSETGTKQKVQMGLPAFMLGATAVLGLLSPLSLIAVIMLARGTAGYIFRETPGRLLGPLMGILMQKNTLALHNIYIEKYYTSNAQLSDDEDSVSDV